MCVGGGCDPSESSEKFKSGKNTIMSNTEIAHKNYEWDAECWQLGDHRIKRRLEPSFLLDGLTSLGGA